jgi:lipopolysaccharide exporter
MAKNYWITSGFYALLNQLSQLIFNLGTVAIIWRVLDEKACGVWVLYLTITAFIEVGRTGLLQNGLMRFLASTPASEHAKINTASLFLSLSLSVLFVLGLLFGGSAISHFFDSPQLVELLGIYAATTFVLSGLYQFNFIQQANLDFRGLFWSSFVKNGLLFSYVLYLFLGHKTFNINNLAYMQLFAAFPATVIAYFYAKRFFSLSKRIDWYWVQQLFQYGKYTFGTNIATMTYKNVDKGLLGRFLLEKVSTYDLALKVNTLAEMPSLTLATILFPQSVKRANTATNMALESQKNVRNTVSRDEAESIKGGATAKYLYEKSVGIILSIIVPMVIFILLFADNIVTVIGSEKYIHSAPVLRLTIFYGIFMAFAMQFGTILDAIGKPKLNFYITALGAVVNLSFNYWFIQWFGLYGAAYGSILAMSLMFCIMQFILNRLLGVHIFNVFGHMLGFYKAIWVKCWGFFMKKRFKTA